MEPLKEMFNKKFYQRLAGALQNADKKFNPKKFVEDVTADMEDMSLNQRMRNTSIQMKKHLPGNYRTQVKTMQKTVQQMSTGYTTLIFPDFVGLYGHDEVEFSLEALAYFTSYGSSEFAIREYLKRNPRPVLKTMEKWAENKSEHIRRLASEGSRPRLPWSFKLDEIIKNPALTRNILEKLNTDNSLYVRKSVANHLNDFSKDHTDYMLGIVESWNKDHQHTSWIIKHACRTLIKKGNPRALNLFSFNNTIHIDLEKFKLDKSQVQLGDNLSFEFSLVSTGKKTQKLVVDYRIHYFKKNGLSPKVFKLKEITLDPGEKIQIKKKQLFKDLTTRKHYSGEHRVEVLVNGNILGTKKFKLVC